MRPVKSTKVALIKVSSVIILDVAIRDIIMEVCVSVASSVPYAFFV